MDGVNQLLGGVSGIDQGLVSSVILYSGIAGVVIAVLVVVNVIRKWRVDSALMRMAKDIHEMNERQKGLISGYQTKKNAEQENIASK